MGPLTIEGTVEHGQIRLKDQVHLPDNTKVYVVVPEGVEQRPLHFSPRLVHPEQAKHFVLEVIEDEPDAQL